MTFLREELDPKTYEAARAEGLAMTFEQAVAYALEEDEASPAKAVNEMSGSRGR